MTVVGKTNTLHVAVVDKDEHAKLRLLPYNEHTLGDCCLPIEHTRPLNVYL